MLACLWACEERNTFLFGGWFVLQMDRHALVTLLTIQHQGCQSMSIAKWAAHLFLCNCKVWYQKGQENVVKD